MLVIGRHTDMMARVIGMLRHHNYHPVGTLTNEVAL